MFYLRLPLLCLLLGFFTGFSTLAQNPITPVSDFTLRTDTVVLRYTAHKVAWKDRTVLPFAYRTKTAELEITLEVPLLDPDASIELLRSADFSVVDSLEFASDNELRFKIRCTNLNQTDVLTLNLRVADAKGSERLVPVYLYPYALPQVQWKVNDDELYLGEEKIFELNGNQLDQVLATNLWETGNGYEYKLRMGDTRLWLSVLPKQAGPLEVSLPLRLSKPMPIGSRFATDLTTLSRKFTVKTGRLAFLTLDKTDVIAEAGIGQPIEIQIDHARYLPTRKTYRIENQEEKGGSLVAEIFTRSLLANDKMLCWLKPYGYHRLSDGYLYIKDGDDARFITNFNLIEKASIRKVSVLHEGADWSENLTVNPGERIDIRLEGSGLRRSMFNLEGIEEVVKDSTISTDEVMVYHARIPIDFNKRKVSLLHNKKPSGFELAVREFQVPRALDFVSLDYGAGYRPITDFNKPILYDKTIQNVVLRFQPEKIETNQRLYGKQYLSIDINLYNNRKELIEYKRIENVVVCPGENSVRFAYYDNRDCNFGEIALNNLMIRKTQDLPDWSRVEIIVRDNPQKYASVAFTHKIELIQQRRYTFDIDVSFPAGLIIKKVGVPGLGNLYGISTAIVAQAGFYRPDKIEKLYPFKIGAGFIALNAFNFAESSDRDVGLVALGSVFPTKINARFSFPLYLGFGYLLKAERWFYVMGPGVQVRF